MALCLKLKNSTADLVMFSCPEALVTQQQSQIFASIDQKQYSLIKGYLVRSKQICNVWKEMYRYKAENMSKNNIYGFDI